MVHAWFHDARSMGFSHAYNSPDKIGKKAVVKQDIFVSEKFRQKRPSDSSSGIFFRQTSGVARLLFDRSVVALLLIVYLHIHDGF